MCSSTLNRTPLFDPVALTYNREIPICMPLWRRPLKTKLSTINPIVPIFHFRFTNFAASAWNIRCYILRIWCRLYVESVSQNLLFYFRWNLLNFNSFFQLMFASICITGNRIFFLIALIGSRKWFIWKVGIRSMWYFSKVL